MVAFTVIFFIITNFLNDNNLLKQEILNSSNLSKDLV